MKNKNIFELFILNRETLQYEKLNYKTYIYSIFIILFIGSGVGFTSSVKFNNAIEKIPIIVKIWQDEEKEFSPDKLKGLIREMNFKYPDIIYAQAVLESGNFQSQIFKHNRNLFGMKQSQSRTTTNLGTQLNHAIYKDYESSLIDRGLWDEAFTRNLTREQYLDLLGKVYAEDSNYELKLLKIIKDYDL